jgi:hypothetical protein
MIKNNIPLTENSKAKTKRFGSREEQRRQKSVGKRWKQIPSPNQRKAKEMLEYAKKQQKLAEISLKSLDEKEARIEKVEKVLKEIRQYLEEKESEGGGI